MTTLDLDFVRAQFPAFAHPEMGQWAHLENAGGSYCPSQVVDLLTDLFAHAKCQPNWDFGPSVVATEAMDRSLPSADTSTGLSRCAATVTRSPRLLKSER